MHQRRIHLTRIRNEPDLGEIAYLEHGRGTAGGRADDVLTQPQLARDYRAADRGCNHRVRIQFQCIPRSLDRLYFGWGSAQDPEPVPRRRQGDLRRRKSPLCAGEINLALLPVLQCPALRQIQVVLPFLVGLR